MGGWVGGRVFVVIFLCRGIASFGALITIVVVFLVSLMLLLVASSSLLLILVAVSSLLPS